MFARRCVLALAVLSLCFLAVRAAPRSAVFGGERVPQSAESGERERSVMSYGEAKAFIERYARPVELARGESRVLLAPAWQGRVMTSTCAGEAGRSFGFVHREFIAAGKPDPRFNNYGGEERLWLSPEGGPFSLWFKPGVAQTLENWYTAPALNEGEWKVVAAEPARCTMQARLALENTAGTKFLFDLNRTVRLLSADDGRRLLGEPIAELLGRSAIRWVGYESENELTNRGAALAKQSGLVSIWMLGMLNAGPQTVVVVPYRGQAPAGGSVVKSDYFGAVPPARLKTLPEAVLFRADGQYRSKIGIGPVHAKNILGAIDFETPSVTLVHFDLPDDPTRCDYLNNSWGPQDDPFRGDVVNSYNDGPNELGRRLGDFYEIESLSPARELAPGEKLVHRQRTIHVTGPRELLEEVVKGTLGVSWSVVRREMLP